MKQTIRLTESELRNMIAESVKGMLNELDPRTYALYADKRQQQADNSANPNDRAKYQQKANQGVEAAQNAWNQQYGFNYNNGQNDWAERKMGGNNKFTHNNGSKYGINYRGERPNLDGGYAHTNMAYNPKTNQEWTGDGRGNSTVRQSSREQEYGDNGAYSVARQMEQGNGTYVKGQGWQNESLIHKIVKESVQKIMNESWYNNWGDFKRAARNTAVGAAMAASTAAPLASCYQNNVQQTQNQPKVEYSQQVDPAYQMGKELVDIYNNYPLSTQQVKQKYGDQITNSFQYNGSQSLTKQQVQEYQRVGSKWTIVGNNGNGTFTVFFLR